MTGGPNQCQQNASVYVIEDDIPTGELITQVLNRNGYKVRVFYNAEQAYNVISTEISTFHHVHIVILDAVLNHEKDGVWNQNRQTESAERFIVKMTNTFPRTRIILMSGEISARKSFEFIFKGASDYFQKPISKSDLTEIVNKHIEISKNKCQYSVDPWRSIKRTNRGIFLSYAKGDHKWARGLVRLLEKNELHVWFAEEDIAPGSDWYEELKSAHDRCPVFLCLLSKAALQSNWVGAEIKKALDRKNAEAENYLLIPLLFNIKLDDVPGELRKFQCVDVSYGDKIVDSFQVLKFSIDKFTDVYNL